MNLKSYLPAIAKPIIAIMASLVVAAVFVKLTGGSPIESGAALISGAFGNTNNILRTLAKSTPLIVSGLAVAVALRAGLFNIGAEGQLLVGGLASATVGFAVKSLPAIVHLPLAIIAGMIAGAAWAFIPGFLKAWRGTHEVIVTIMMNYIAIQLMQYLVSGPLKDPNGTDRTPEVVQTAWLWSYGHGTDFSIGFLLAILAAFAIHFLLKRTSFGYEIRAVGLGQKAAEVNGINVKRTMVTAMCISGSLAGLAGAIEVLAVSHRFTSQFSAGYGFDSIAVALLGGLEAGGVVAAGTLFGAINNGTRNMEMMTDTSRHVAGIIQSIIIIAVGIRTFKRKRN